MTVRGRWIGGVVIVAGLIGALWLGFLTREGLFIGPDSTAYIGGAQNVADGKGFTLPFVPVTAEVNPVVAASYDGAAPMYHYSPLLPLTLGTAVQAGISATTAARGLNILAYGICTALLAWAVLRVTRGSLVATGAAVAFFVTTGVLMITLGSVATEALFVPLCLAALALLAVWITTPRWWWASAFVVLAGASTLARTVGIALAATGALVVLCWYPAALRGRLLRALGVGIACSLPLLAWRAYDASSVGELAYHPPRVLRLRHTITSWYNGDWNVTWDTRSQTLVLVAFVVLAVIAVILVRRYPPRTTMTPVDRTLVRVAAVFCVVYTVMLYLTITFIVITVPFGTRYILPVLPPFVFLVAFTGWRLVNATQPRAVRRAVLAVLAFVLVPAAYLHATVAVDSMRDPLAPLRRGPNATLRSVRALPENSVVFTNAPDVVYLETGRYAVTLPPRESIWSGEPNAAFRRDRAALGRALCEKPGVVALLGGGYQGFEARRLIREAGLEVAGFSSDGLLLQVDPTRCAALKG